MTGDRASVWRARPLRPRPRPGGPAWSRHGFRHQPTGPARPGIPARRDGRRWRLALYRCDPPLRPDLDSTSVALRALRGAGVALDYGVAADRLGAYRNRAGRFRTWAEASLATPALQRGARRALRRWFNPVDPVERERPGFSPGGVGRTAPRAEQFLLRWARTPGALGAGPYYLHPECLAYALSKVTESRSSADATRAAASALVLRLLDTARSQPFLLARRLAAVVRLGLARPDLNAAVEILASHQRADGSWPWGEVWTAVRWAAGAPRPLLGSPALETAIAIEVLARWPPC
jgi:hypothetical protein